MSVRMRSGAVGSIVAAVISALILLAAASLAGLSAATAEDGVPEPSATVTVTSDPSTTPTGTPTSSETVDPTATATATASPDPTTTSDPTPTATATATPEPTVTPTPVPPGWATQHFTLADGRAYYARVPVCAPAETPECSSWLSTPRQLVVVGHGYGAGETLDVARATLDIWASLRKAPDTLFAYLVSKNGTRAFNGGICCTFNDVDDVSYAAAVVDDLARNAAVNTARVGILGTSNGGMLALKAACERPDVFDAGSSFAGTFPGPCPKAGVRVSQIHGGADKYIPARGGTAYLAGHWFTVPPAVDLGSSMAPGNVFPLTIVAGVGHNPTYPIIVAQLNWVLANLRG
ncbi:prolyl oligopeptidase family serine peptidase [Nocardioides sp.]|uniref:prolyl oligopeptidase family serine peptidase n=1 Tax=Nocardioides sp. TaxID=35761 RepID=UPI002C0820C0|nr:prolyl oligopeptidase family serine peptidase [Nocardioides sp.]HSX68359.1 prolyl oligopeptidase family serine peptidase [Nocardioides sp.]